MSACQEILQFSPVLYESPGPGAVGVKAAEAIDASKMGAAMGKKEEAMTPGPVISEINGKIKIGKTKVRRGRNQSGGGGREGVWVPSKVHSGVKNP